MNRFLQALLLWIVLITSASAETDFNTTDKTADAVTKEEGRLIPTSRNWYAGGAIGLSYLTGWDRDHLSDAYYKSQGYGFYEDIPHGVLSEIITSASEKYSWEGKIYGGYKLLNYMDIEMGYTRNDNWNPTNDYKNYSTGATVKSQRQVHAQALYASLSFRPIPEGRGHGLYFKLGGHASELRVSKKITGTAPNLNTLAAGDNLPYDGETHGYGTLYGVGFDFKTVRYGAVRLEWSHFNKLGGTPFGKSSINIGYHGFF